MASGIEIIDITALVVSITTLIVGLVKIKAKKKIGQIKEDI